MKILEEKLWALEFTCAKCESKLEAAAEDVRIHEDPRGCDDWERYPYVVCPICDSVKQFEWSKLTPKVEAMARRTSHG